MRSREAGRILRQLPNGEFAWVKLSAREFAAAERARKADDAWFAANPNRSHRLRPATAYEIPNLSPAEAAESWFVVRQLAPGRRVKRLFTPPNPPLPDLEEIGHALFDPISERLVSETTAETAEITPTEIRRRAAMLITRGRA